MHSINTCVVSTAPEKFDDLDNTLHRQKLKVLGVSDVGTQLTKPSTDHQSVSWSWSKARLAFREGLSGLRGSILNSRRCYGGGLWWRNLKNVHTPKQIPRL